MNPLLKAATEIQGFLEQQHWRFCLIGGLAVLRWGEPRTTQDVDITVRQADCLDWPYVERELKSLCELKEAPEILERLQRLRNA